MKNPFSLLRRWTMWTDILVFNYVGESYVLQGRRHIRTGRSQFAIRRTKQSWRVAECGALTDLFLLPDDMFTDAGINYLHRHEQMDLR